MATKIRKSTSQKKIIRFKRKKRIRGSVIGTSERPRFSVFRSNTHMYVQLIDDEAGCTLVSASTSESELAGKAQDNLEGAKVLGGVVAKRALAKKIDKVVFDRSGYLYHGRIKVLADAAREAGLVF